MKAALARALRDARTAEAGGQPAAAYERLRDSLQLGPRPHAGTTAVLAFMQRYAPRTRHAEVDALWQQALAEGWARPADLALPVATHLARDAEIAAALNRSLSLPALAQQLEGDALFHALLRCTVIADPRWESLLLSLTQYLSARPADPSLAALTETLALWVWLSERLALPPATPAEPSSITPLTACTLAHAALRQPLRAVDWALAVLPDSECAQVMIREPLVEQALINRWPAPAVHDRAVAAHYETAPYPRWRREPLGLPVSLPPAVAAKLATAALQRPSVLIAGCGTGQQLFVAHDSYAKARLTALDISRHSLAYARRQCESAGVAVAEWRCMDLLDVQHKPDRYGIVECIGVLHHLADPAAGLRALAAVTVPGGLLHAAVYSRRARAQVTAVRAQLLEAGIDLAAMDVRVLRQALLRGDYGAVDAALIQSVDFYSVSGCRDLLLNARERVYDLPAFVAEAAAAGFDWLALSPPAAVATAAARRFGKPAERLTVAEWHAMEEQLPRSFGGMFDCWFLRRRP